MSDHMHDTYLPGYQCQLQDDAVQHSIDKLKQSKGDLQLKCSVEIQIHPCTSEEETLRYRCNCSFQMILVNENQFFYAMREKGRPVLLGSSTFPIANLGIQAVMTNLLQQLNDKQSHNHALRRHLTSVSFSSSWDEKEIIVTLHYNSPVEENEWLTQASLLRTKLQILKLSGRSKGRLLSVPPEAVYLRDTIWIDPIHRNVTVGQRDPAKPTAIQVDYWKQETAFFHPNSRTMTQALTWIMSRLTTMSTSNTKANSLLEMYCGCGAHTIALAKLGLLTDILAMELDQRLVEACIRNAQLNQCHEQGRTPVTIVQGDAGPWAKKVQKQSARHYDVLLVDPPRQGLDSQVCDMAMQGTFHHFLYISCGRDALKRDLEILMTVFTIVDCQLFDLFPRTDSIESVVHLRRKVVQ